MQPIFLLRDEIVEYGMTQHRIRAMRNGIVIHTILRWSEMAASHAMTKWITNNVSLVDADQLAN